MTTQLEAMKMMVEAITEMNDLISETSGVYGLHLNGDPSPWGEIEAGGRFERLTLKDDALAAGRAAIEAAEKVEPVGRINKYGNFCDLRGPLLPPFEPGTLLYLHPPSAEIEELRRDAARYRYLRTPKAGKHKVMFWLNEPARYVDLSWNELDYAIDSAMEKQL